MSICVCVCVCARARACVCVCVCVHSNTASLAFLQDNPGGKRVLELEHGIQAAVADIPQRASVVRQMLVLFCLELMQHPNHQEMSVNGLFALRVRFRLLPPLPASLCFHVTQRLCHQANLVAQDLSQGLMAQLRVQAIKVQTLTSATNTHSRGNLPPQLGHRGRVMDRQRRPKVVTKVFLASELSLAPAVQGSLKYQYKAVSKINTRQSQISIQGSLKYL